MFGKHSKYPIEVTGIKERHEEVAERAPWIRRNNWMLPLREDPPRSTLHDGQHYVDRLGMSARIRMEKAATFNELSRSFWLDHFGDMTATELKKQMRLLGLPPLPRPVHKSQLVAALVTYYQSRFNHPTRR